MDVDGRPVNDRGAGRSGQEAIALLEAAGHVHDWEHDRHVGGNVSGAVGMAAKRSRDEPHVIGLVGGEGHTGRVLYGPLAFRFAACVGPPGSLVDQSWVGAGDRGSVSRRDRVRICWLL